MNEEAQSTPNTNDTQAATQRVLDSVLKLGTVWADYGISVGRLALRTQSQWLRSVADILAHTANALDVKLHRDAESPSTAAGEQHDTHAA